MTINDLRLKRDEMLRVMDDYLCDIGNNDKRKKYFEALEWLSNNKTASLNDYVSGGKKGMKG